MCCVDTVRSLAHAGDDRRHYLTIRSTVVFPSYLIDKPEVGLLKPLDAAFKRTAGKVGNHLEPDRYRGQVVDTQTFHENADFAFGDNIRRWTLNFL